MFAYSVVLFSSSAYLFYHSWKYLSTHFSCCVLAFMTLCVASFVFLCRKYIFTQSKKNSSTKKERSNLERLLRSISIFRTVFMRFFQNPFLCLLHIKFCITKNRLTQKNKRNTHNRLLHTTYSPTLPFFLLWHDFLVSQFF